MPKTRTNWLRRDNETVEKAIALLAAQGVIRETDKERERAGRRIEDHSRRYLLPPGNPTPEELVPRQATFARNEMTRSASLSLWRLRQAM
jgi:hypothetical protein